MRTAAVTLLLMLPSIVQSSPTALPLAIYKDKQLGFSFTYPAEFVATPEVGDGATSSTGGCETIPLIALRKVTEHQVELIEIIRLDFICLKQSASVGLLKPMATQALQQGLEKIGRPTLLPAISYQVDGHEAVFVQGSAPDASDGVTGHAGVVCVLASNSGIVCWSALTAYPSHLKKILSNQIQFTGGSAQALVPVDQIQTPPGKDP